MAATSGGWPGGAKAAISLTLDNMGEAADLNRGLWPQDQSIGSHHSVKVALPQMLAILKKYDIHVTYFIESWNLTQYGHVIADQVAAAGHEVAWHAWQHEAWSKLSDAEERENFERSFGDEGIRGFIKEGKGKDKVQSYRGFRPPGGIIHGDRTLSLCRAYGLGYISPAAEHAALVSTKSSEKLDSMVILPFRWTGVDAFYYMDAFSRLRELKGRRPEPIDEDGLVEQYKATIDGAIQKGEFVSLLFHPFLTVNPRRFQAFETIVQYLATKRDDGSIWLATCKEIEQHVRAHPNSVAEDPSWDNTSWR